MTNAAEPTKTREALRQIGEDQVRDVHRLCRVRDALELLADACERERLGKRLRDLAVEVEQVSRRLVHVQESMQDLEGKL